METCHLGLPRSFTMVARDCRGITLFFWGFLVAFGSLIIPAGYDARHMVSLRTQVHFVFPDTQPDTQNTQTHKHPDPQTLTLCLDGVGVDGGIGAPRSTARLQDVHADPACDARQLGGLQDEGLPVLGQQLGAALVTRERRQALGLLARHVATGASRLLQRTRRNTVTGEAGRGTRRTLIVSTILIQELHQLYSVNIILPDRYPTNPTALQDPNIRKKNSPKPHNLGKIWLLHIGLPSAVPPHRHLH